MSQTLNSIRQRLKESHHHERDIATDVDIDVTADIDVDMTIDMAADIDIDVADDMDVDSLWS
jgi:hypothetical protein